MPGRVLLIEDDAVLANALRCVLGRAGDDVTCAGDPNREAVDSLVAQGVRLDVCLNTVHTVERNTGGKLALNPNAPPVAAGAAQLIALSERTYTLLRP